uniref:Ral guanine nucleotide dissociation stimulator-like 2 n=3 Tax=Schistocephalus solidus TaxID=70667 RepID=A0A0X3PHD5_SCHSO
MQPFSNSIYQDNELSAGTIGQILDALSEIKCEDLAFTNIRTLLLTYHLHLSSREFLTAIDEKFWSSCFDQCLWASQKYNILRFLSKLLTCWLDSPYAEVFYSPPEFDDLNYLYSVGSHWLNVFADVLPSTHLTQTSRSSSKRKTSVEYVSKAKVAVMSITKPQQVDLAYNFERLCHKIGSLLERYCLNAGLFKEVSAEGACALPDKSLLKNTLTKTSLHLPSFADFSVTELAEQLTYQDKVLFSNVFPPDCLNYVRQRPAPTIEPTIKQFNQVYRLVITTILESPPNSHSQVSSFFDNPSFASTLALTSASVSFTGNYLRRGEAVTSQALKAAVVDAAVESSQQQESGLAQRTDRIAKWVSVTARLRDLRSFSAFKAVITALQSCAIQSLRQSWNQFEIIYPAHHQRLEALAQLLSLEDNQKNARELLDHTLSSLEIDKPHGRSLLIPTIFRRKANFEQGSIDEAVHTMGTIPYLGLFLNDLAMLNESAPDWIPKREAGVPRRPNSSSRCLSRRSSPAMINHSRTSLGSTRAPSPSETASTVSGTTETRRNFPPVYDKRSGRSSRELDSNGEPGLPYRHKREASITSCPGGTATSRSTLRSETPVIMGFRRKNKTSNSCRSNVDKREGQLINFHKHKREYAVLSKLIELQRSAKRFSLVENKDFAAWLRALPLLSEDEAIRRALELEPGSLSPKGTTSATPASTSGCSPSESLDSHTSEVSSPSVCSVPTTKLDSGTTTPSISPAYSLAVRSNGRQFSRKFQGRYGGVDLPYQMIPPHPKSQRNNLANRARDPNRHSLDCLRMDTEREEMPSCNGKILADVMSPNDTSNSLRLRLRRNTRSSDRATLRTPEPMVESFKYTDVPDPEDCLRVAHF